MRDFFLLCILRRVFVLVGLMNVARVIFWGGSRSTKFFFGLKRLRPALKGTSFPRRVRPGSFLTQNVPPMCFAQIDCPVCNNKHWLCFGNVLPCKGVAANDERYLVCATDAAGVFSCAKIYPPFFFATVCIVLWGA